MLPHVAPQILVTEVRPLLWLVGLRDESEVERPAGRVAREDDVVACRHPHDIERQVDHSVAAQGAVAPLLAGERGVQALPSELAQNVVDQHDVVPRHRQRRDALALFFFIAGVRHARDKAPRGDERDYVGEQRLARPAHAGVNHGQRHAVVESRTSRTGSARPRATRTGALAPRRGSPQRPTSAPPPPPSRRPAWATPARAGSWC